MKVAFFQLLIMLSAWPGRGQKVILNEDFTQNSRQWLIQATGNDHFTFSNGKYILEGFSDSTRFSAIPVKLDNGKGFSISLSATHVGGAENYAYGLYLGNKSGSNSYMFVISAIGFYKFYGYQNGVYKQFIDWTSHTGLHKGSGKENDFMMAREKENWKLFLNGQAVATLPASIPLEETYAGVIRSNKQKVQFDDLVIIEPQ